MTALQIVPNWKNKTARIKGTIAAGELVAVEIVNDNGAGGEFISDVATLRLRVIDECGRTLAQFPMPEEVLPSFMEEEDPEYPVIPNEWDPDVTPLRCTLNLNTVQMLRAVPPHETRQLCIVLDDYENKTLFFKDVHEFSHWPRRYGEEQPIDLGGYKDFVEGAKAAIAGFEQRVVDVEATAANASVTASQASTVAQNAQTAAVDAQNSAAASAERARISEAAATDFSVIAQRAAQQAKQYAESITQPDTELDPESVNAVENRAICDGLDLKADKTALTETNVSVAALRNDFNDLNGAVTSHGGLAERLTTLENNTYRKVDVYTKAQVNEMLAQLPKGDDLPLVVADGKLCIQYQTEEEE